MLRNHAHTLLLAVFVALACLRSAAAQCSPQWLPGEPRLSPGGAVRASTLWDPDGAGPLPLLYVIGGTFAAATTTGANVATWDGSQWSVLAGLGGTVTALGVHNSQLHAATQNTTVIGGIPLTTYSVAVWTGTNWQAIGAPSGPVRAMASYNGQLVLGGSFNLVSGVAASNIAAWNGTNWLAFGSGVLGDVRAFALFNNALWVGGAFSNAGGLPVGNLAQWNGSWFAGPSFNGAIEALGVRSATSIAQTYLFAAGAFTSFTVGAATTTAAHIARCDALNLAWVTVGTGLPGTRCTSLVVRLVGVNGYEVAAGVEDSASMQRVWRFASGAWSALGSIGDGATNVWPAALGYYLGRYTAGLSDSPSAVRAFDGTSWINANGAGIAGTVFAVASTGSDLVIGGAFPTISGATVNGIARGGPGAWQALGTGVQGGLGVLALAVAPNADVIATGSFTSAGGQSAYFIARWNGSTWAPLGSGLLGIGNSVLALPGGDIIAGGNFTIAGGVTCNHIARWNGSTWAPLGAGIDGAVYALARLDNGDIVAAGSFTTAGGLPASNIARWNGASWSPLGTGLNGLAATLTVATNGDLFAGGNFTTAGGITTRIGKWSNGAWSGVLSVGITSEVISLCAHPNGDLFVGGEVFSFSLGPFGGWTSNLVRITNGGSLSPMNVQGIQVIGSTIHDGDLVIAGAFDTAGGISSPNVARFHTPCPATATSFGAGCSGLTAPLSLAALTPPWIGGAWRLRASTFAPASFALRAVGFAPLPSPILLSLILPGSLPGCVGLVPPDVTEVYVPTAGVLTITSTVPLNAALVGLQLDEQIVQFEAAGSGLAVSSSNAVQLVVGAL